MTKAFSYLRVSGSEQAQSDRDGYPRQRTSISAYAAANNLEIVREFAEDISGTKETLDRPAWIQMMAALNGTRTIVIEALHRFSRDLIVQELGLKDLKKHGITLLFVEPIDVMSEHPAAVFNRQVLGATAQYVKSDLVVRLKVARLRKKAATGRCEGKLPYGTHEGEALVVRRIQVLRAAGMNWERIAASLNAEGTPTRTSGKRWHGATVARIINRKEAN